MSAQNVDHHDEQASLAGGGGGAREVGVHPPAALVPMPARILPQLGWTIKLAAAVTGQQIYYSKAEHDESITGGEGKGRIYIYVYI